MLFNFCFLLTVCVLAIAGPTPVSPSGIDIPVVPGPSQSPTGDMNTGVITEMVVRVGRKSDGAPGYGCEWVKNHMSQAEQDALPQHKLAIDVPWVPADGKPFDFVLLNFNAVRATWQRYNISGPSADGKDPCGTPIEGAFNPYTGCYDGGADNKVPMTCVWFQEPNVEINAPKEVEMWHANGIYTAS